MVDGFWALLVGLITGVVSGCGIGGGSLLMLYLTVIAGVATNEAAVINLLYFLGCALPAIRTHQQNRLIRGDAAWRCLPTGLPAAVLGAFVAMWLDTGWLHRGFGVFLLYIGFKELFYKEKAEER